jgi:hypothetical protein
VLVALKDGPSIVSGQIRGRAQIVAARGCVGGLVWDRLHRLLTFLRSHLRLPKR